MPALDFKDAIVGSVTALLRANAGVTATFKAGNIHDERTTGPARRRQAQRSASDFPSIDVEVTGGDEQVTRTPTFGLAGPATPTCDAIVPITVTLTITMKFAKEKLDDQTAGETYVRQALHQGYPKLGLAYVRDFTIRERRGKPTPQSGTSAVKEVVWDVTVNLRLHLSQLRD